MVTISQQVKDAISMDCGRAPRLKLNLKSKKKIAVKAFKDSYFEAKTKKEKNKSN